MRAGESFLYGPLNGVSATPSFQLDGGRYWWDCVGTFGSATAVLQRLGSDGATWLTVGTAGTVTANGGGVFDLPPGTYQVAVTGGTNSVLYTSVIRVNLE